MARKPQNIYQYEPLVTPTQWTGDERLLVLRLTQIVDDLYAKIGRLQDRVKKLEGSDDASI